MRSAPPEAQDTKHGLDPTTGESAPPDFFIVGAPKCGTTSLHFYLQQHPSICMSNCSEPGYYSGDSRAASLEEYLRLYFYHWKSPQIRGEATTAYLRCSRAREAIHADNPSARIVVLVRPHSDALYSWHWQLSRYNTSPRDANEVLAEELAYHRSEGTSGIDHGYFSVFRYRDQIESYQRTFGPESVRVWTTQTLAADPIATLDELCEFLEVPKHDWSNADLSKRNTATAVSGWKNAVKELAIKGIRVAPLAKRLPITWRMRAHGLLDGLASRRLVREPLAPELRAGIDEYFRDDARYLADEHNASCFAGAASPERGESPCPH